MIADRTLARRYLLGEAGDEERDRLEREYFADDEAQDAIAAAEDELIDDYLDGALSRAERSSFERTYLASLHHRQRVDTVRRLRAAAPAYAAAASARRRLVQMRTAVLAAAAVVLLGIGASMWIQADRRVQKTASVARPARPSAVSAAPKAAPASPASPRVFAFSIPPVTFRGGDEPPALVIPAGTDVVALRFEGGGAHVDRAAVATVSGADVWQGPATAAADGTVIVNVPASKLQPDDYIVALSGGPAEQGRYALRVRAR